MDVPEPTMEYSVKPTIYPITTSLPFRLSIVARPRGGDSLHHELSALAKDGIEILVSMLPTEEAEELGLALEATECDEAAIRFVNIPLPDRSVPPDALQFRKAVEELAVDLRAGKSIGVHCRAGIGRSFLLAASLLIVLGIPADETFRQIEASRGCRIPDTPGQAEWVRRNFATL